MSAPTKASPQMGLIDAVAELVDALAYEAALRSDYRAHRASVTGAHDELRAAANERIGEAASRVGRALGDDYGDDPVCRGLLDRVHTAGQRARAALDQLPEG